MGTREGACGEQERNRRDGDTALFREDPGEQDDISVMEEEFDGAMHLGGLGPL